MNVEKFIAFLNQHKNAKGYVNLGISERREVSQYGETHTAWLDTWSPDTAKRPSDAPNRQPEAKASVLRDDLQAGLRKVKAATEADDVPF